MITAADAAFAIRLPHPQAKLKDLRRAASDAGVQGLDLPLAAVSTGGEGILQGWERTDLVWQQRQPLPSGDSQLASQCDATPAVGEFRQLAVWAQEDPTRLDQVCDPWGPV